MKVLLALVAASWATLSSAGQIRVPVSAPTLDALGLVGLAVMVGVVGGIIARRKK